MKVTLTAQLLEKVRSVDEYDLRFVAERPRGDGLADEQIGTGVIEFKKYLTLFALGHEDPGRGSSAAINPDAVAFSS